ncbi:DUF421 domain-containing protein [Nostocoides veronense]|uniref:YetF C-terminal domain-containing protein n=1 Tax=Nostocoides veronense TaxID=330836 RepID=A0ABN2LLZ9_9MICO
MTTMLAGSVPTLMSRSISNDLWAFQIPPLEKVLRTVLVYLAILVIVRVAGKRLLAQMNSLDLVVVLLLSNVVQNAIIGDDNSLVGGVLGAVVLVAANAGLERIAQVFPAFRRVVEGRPTPVVRDGEVIDGALDRLGMTRGELNWALRHQGADRVSEVETATLDPGGSLTVDLKDEEQALSQGEFRAEMARLHARLDALASRPTTG